MLPLSPTRTLLLTNEHLSNEVIKVGSYKMREVYSASAGRPVCRRAYPAILFRPSGATCL
jgi:hypothetical protein